MKNPFSPNVQELAAYISIPTPSAWEQHCADAFRCYDENWLDVLDWSEILAYYEFPELYYPDRLARELALLKQDRKLNFICFLMRHILTRGTSEDILGAWGWGAGCTPFAQHGSPVICAVALLSAQAFHKETIARLNYDEEQILIHKKGIRNCWVREHEVFGIDGTSFALLAWGSYYLRGNLVTIGRLQFEYGVKAAAPEHFPVKDANYVWLHVPAGKGDLTKEAIIQSICLAEESLHRYFPSLPDKPNIYCINSWLLSPQLPQLLPPDSNILKFQRLFTVTDYYEGASSFLINIFHIKNRSVDYALLPEDTRLQRGVKAYLLQNKPLENGVGYFAATE